MTYREGVTPSRFTDRREAGRLLGAHLLGLHDWPETVVLGLPRGGVPVAAQVARALSAPLDVFVVRKLGMPGHAELALGAIASGGVRVLNQDLLARLQVSERDIAQVEAGERAELQRRESLYRRGRPPLDLAGKTAVLVDDGTATGATMRAAARAVRLLKPARVVIALPVAPPDTAQELEAEADEVVCLLTPPFFYAVGQFYADFKQTSDAEVQAWLAPQDGLT